MKIAVFSSKRYERDFVDCNPEITEKLKANDLHLEYLNTRLDCHTAPLAEGSDAVCVFVNDTVDADTIATLAGKGTKCVLLRCAGFNCVDLKAAKEHDVTVLRVPAYSPHSVAEFATALLLTVVRKTHKAYNRTRESNFSLRGLMGFNLHGKTVGLCGTGKIGRLFGKIMLSFGCKVIAYDIYPSQEAKDMGVEYVKFEDVMRGSDIISLHCPLLPSTRHMIDHDAVAKMREGTVLINTSRGELVDMDALLQGLRNRTIAGCGMDVVEGEEALFFDDHTGEILEDEKFTRLLAFPNVLITPHIAFCTDIAMTNIWTATIKNATDYEGRNDGRKLENEVRYT